MQDKFIISQVENGWVVSVANRQLGACSAMWVFTDPAELGKFIEKELTQQDATA